MNGDNNIHYSPALPDFKWINAEIPILEVAQKLGLVVRGKKATCPASTFRLTWWSQALQAWLSYGYATPHTLSPHPPDSTGNSETLGVHTPVEQRLESGLKVITEGNSRRGQSDRCQQALVEGGSES